MMRFKWALTAFFFTILACSTALPAGEVEDLASAVMGGDFPRVRNIINRNPSLANARGIDGWCPLHYASAMGRVRIALYLIENGADLNTRDNDEWSPLHLAAYQGQKELALLLIARGADVNARDRAQCTPLHYAVNSYHNENFNDIALELIAHGSDVNARSTDGKTPLRLSLERGKIDITRLLKEKGATE